jgi:hypothetical protein
MANSEWAEARQTSDMWWCVQSGRQDGPMSLDELKDKLRDVDTREVFVWRGGFEDWKRVEDVAELTPPRPLEPPPFRAEAQKRKPIRRGLFRLWAAASLIWMLSIIAIAIGAELHLGFRVSDRTKSVPPREAVDKERERQEAYKRGPLLENLKTGYEEAVRRGLVSPSNEAFVVHTETGDILYRPAGADNNWEPIVVAVVKNTREMFGLVSKKWKQISEQGRPGITRRIEDALRDTNNEWVLVNFPGEIGDVMFSPNFEALSPDERNTAGREFFETLKPPIEIQARSELLNPRFWIILLGPPLSVGVPLLLIAWIVLGFRGSETT